MFGRVRKKLRQIIKRRRLSRWQREVERAVAACGPGLYVGGKCDFSFSQNIRLGSNVSFNGMTIYGRGGVTIGDNFHSGAGCKIITANHNYEGEALPYDATVVLGPVVVGDNVWFGDDVLVLPGVEIAEGAVVGARSVVTKDVEKCAIVGGNPARIIKHRDIERYERLKRDGKFI